MSSTEKDKPAGSANPPTKARVPRSPEVQKRLDELHKATGPAMVASLNHNVKKHDH